LAVLAAAGLVAGALAASPVSAAAAPAAGFVSYDSFLASLSTAKYQTAAAAGQTGAVGSAQAFDEMRGYAQTMYKGVQVSHSYVADGNYFDCVDVQTQPTARALGLTKLATPPPAADRQSAAAAAGTAATQPGAGRADAYGNAMSCGAGTIPMERISLDRMTRFKTLHDFLAKQPGKSTPAGSAAPAANAHRYAIGYQYVNNHGGNSWLNLWNPSGEFSLSQQWYVAGSGSGTQTVEGGWVKYAPKFGNQSVLFIFFTPNNYASGCYNLDCTGFVQTSSAFTLGGAWSNYSTYGGAQYGFSEQWQYFQGNWWLYIQGTAIGYYPGSIYGSGPLASGGSTLTEFGGETYTGGTSQPQMGSGMFANAGFGYAAYQRTVFYINTAQGSAWSSLTPLVTHPACYTFEYHDSSEGSSWGTYFYFGGPGGNC
jgi:hypothetical protein